MKYFKKIWVFALFSGLLSCQSGNVNNVNGDPSEIEFLASNYQGNQNIEITFTVKFLESSEYTLNRIEWDPDNDKVIDSVYSLSVNNRVIDSLTFFTYKYKYTEAGVYNPSVSIIYNENEAVSTPILKATFYTDSKGKLIYTNDITIEE
ncbi:MAG TPA: hypothetical protein VHO70_10065 [Chitinispirillaceae bacterium]|nr:hypothetical protein [Chitinispirillaceae bacterium]